MIDPKELIICVDEHNNPIEPRLKIEAHTRGIWHRNSHVWVTNGTHVLCHRRSLLVPSNQGKWEAPFAGHSKIGETPLQTAVVELGEESGITAKSEDMTFHFVHVHDSEKNKEFITVYTTTWCGSIESLHTEAQEVTDVKWYTYKELFEIYTSPDPTWVQVGYEKNILSKLQQS